MATEHGETIPSARSADLIDRPLTRADVPTVLYVAGLGRSGTTLLERMIAAIPGVSPLGEAVFLWQRGIVENQRCGCGVPFRSCEFWGPVGEIAFGGWDRVDVARVGELERAIDDVRHVPTLLSPRLPAAKRALVDEYTDLYARLYAAVRVVSGCDVVIDSSKRTSLAYCLRRADVVDLRVLHALRDSRGVAYSWTKVVKRPEIVGRDEDMPRYSPTYMSLLWNGHNALLDVLGFTGVPTLRVRYEDVIADPVGQLQAIAGFAGLPSAREQFSFVGDGTVTLGAAHTVSGNPMRFSTGAIPLRRDDQWREAMPPRQRRTVSALTAPFRLRYGYTDGTPVSGRTRSRSV